MTNPLLDSSNFDLNQIIGIVTSVLQSPQMQQDRFQYSGYKSNTAVYQPGLLDQLIKGVISKVIPEVGKPNIPPNWLYSDYQEMIRNNMLRTQYAQNLTSQHIIGSTVMRAGLSRFMNDTQTNKVMDTLQNFKPLGVPLFNMAAGMAFGPDANMEKAQALMDINKYYAGYQMRGGSQRFGMSLDEQTSLTNKLFGATYKNNLGTSRRFANFGMTEMTDIMMMGSQYGAGAINEEDLIKNTKNLAKVIQSGMAIYDTLDKEGVIKNLNEITRGSIPITDTSTLNNIMFKFSTIAKYTNASVQTIHRIASETSQLFEQLKLDPTTGASIGASAVSLSQSLTRGSNAIFSQEQLARLGGSGKVREYMTMNYASGMMSDAYKNIAFVWKYGTDEEKQAAIAAKSSGSPLDLSIINRVQERVRKGLSSDDNLSASLYQTNFERMLNESVNEFTKMDLESKGFTKASSEMAQAGINQFFKNKLKLDPGYLNKIKTNEEAFKNAVGLYSAEYNIPYEQAEVNLKFGLRTNEENRILVENERYQTLEARNKLGQEQFKQNFNITDKILSTLDQTNKSTLDMFKGFFSGQDLDIEGTSSGDYRRYMEKFSSRMEDYKSLDPSIREKNFRRNITQWYGREDLETAAQNIYGNKIIHSREQIFGPGGLFEAYKEAGDSNLTEEQINHIIRKSEELGGVNIGNILKVTGGSLFDTNGKINKSLVSNIRAIGNKSGSDAFGSFNYLLQHPELIKNTMEQDIALKKYEENLKPGDIAVEEETRLKEVYDKALELEKEAIKREKENYSKSLSLFDMKNYTSSQNVLSMVTEGISKSYKYKNFDEEATKLGFNNISEFYQKMNKAYSDLSSGSSKTLLEELYKASDDKMIDMANPDKLQKASALYHAYGKDRSGKDYLLDDLIKGIGDSSVGYSKSISANENTIKSLTDLTDSLDDNYTVNKDLKTAIESLTTALNRRNIELQKIKPQGEN